MTRIARQITELIGHTPLLELSNYNRNKRLKARLIGKLEYFNPAGSVKDRVALAMIEDAERSGRLRPGATLIEPTSGNTGVGLALVSAVKGYTLILTMPETMSEERRKLLQAYGARLVLTPRAEGMSGAIAKAEELRDSIPGAVILQQFENPANPAAQARYRRAGRYFRGVRRDGRDYQRDGERAESAAPGHPRRRRRARRISRPLRRQGGAA